MKWIKQFIVVIVILTAGCQKHTPVSTSFWKESDHKLKVLTTIAMIHDIVSEIGQDKVEAISLIRGELDPHSYELVKGDDEKLGQADLIFYNGLGLEHGLSLRQHLEGDSKAIALGQAIFEQDPSLILMTNGQCDPHIWMDISLWAKIIDPIVLHLSKKDPEHAAFYQENGNNLRKKMYESDQKIYQRLQAIPEEKRYLVTSHNAFSYFTRRYLATLKELQAGTWHVRSSAPEGLAPDAELSLSDIRLLIDYIKHYQIATLFTESNVNKDSLKKIINALSEQGVCLKLAQAALYADAMGKEPSYLKMIEHNANVIASEFER